MDAPLTPTTALLHSYLEPEAFDMLVDHATPGSTRERPRCDNVDLFARAFQAQADGTGRVKRERSTDGQTEGHALDSLRNHAVASTPPPPPSDTILSPTVQGSHMPAAEAPMERSTSSASLDYLAFPPPPDESASPYAFSADWTTYAPREYGMEEAQSFVEMMDHHPSADGARYASAERAERGLVGFSPFGDHTVPPLETVRSRPRPASGHPSMGAPSPATATDSGRSQGSAAS